MIRFFCLLGAVLLATSQTGCAPLGHTATNLDRRSIRVDNVQRHYSVHRPAGFDPSRRHAAVFVLHGGGGTGTRVARYTRFVEFADRLGFVAVLPDAHERHWNDGRQVTRRFGNDIDFLLAVLDELIRQDAVDPDRVFVAGVSNGGMMAQRLACDTPHRFSAFASVVANLPASLHPRCKPGHPLPIVLFAGTDDPIVPWNGGEVASTPRHGVGGRVISAPETMQFWADHNDCNSSRIQSLPDRSEDGTQVQRHDFTGCRSGGAVAFYEIIGGGHGWPGMTHRRWLTRITGPITQDIDGTTEIVTFFQTYGL